LTTVVSVPAVILLSLGSSCAALSSFFLWQQIGEVNRKLPDNEQISYWGLHPMKMAKIKREYKRLYPGGKIDLMRQSFQYAALVFIMLMMIPLASLVRQ